MIIFYCWHMAPLQICFNYTTGGGANYKKKVLVDIDAFFEQFIICNVSRAD